jgi:putative membrane protein
MKSTLLVAAATLALVVVWDHPAAAAPTEQFLSEAMKGDNSEVSLGQVAASRAQNAGVRRFGQMLVSDHAKAKGEVQALATDMHVPSTEKMAPEAQQEMSKLKGLQGRAFDREFVAYMVDDHRKDIAKFETEANKRDGKASALAEKQLPVLRHHLAVVQGLQNQIR